MEYFARNMDVLILAVLVLLTYYLKYLEYPQKRKELYKHALKQPVFTSSSDFLRFEIIKLQFKDKTPATWLRVLAIILIIFVAIIPLEQLF
ncbi:hypothetical protein [Tenacibaculum xiamenense]|uniref:hypothetical protein n=1 Tax=Tenacibaculum xiamenense TaxID=1261553 RepID=UPI0038942039